jgi:hypothetical protein
MKRTFKIFVDFDKEENWLNRMTAEGHLLATAGPLYSFIPITPGSAVVRTDYRPRMSAADFDDYVSLFSDAGWQHLRGSRTSGYQYFASTDGATDAEIFSDPGSKAQRYRRALGVNAALAFPFLVLVWILWTTGNSAFDTLLSPDKWYLTPGIWEKQGWEFLGAVLFETPFVALRVGAPILLIAAVLAMLALAVYQGILYRRAMMYSKAG